MKQRFLFFTLMLFVSAGLMAIPSKKDNSARIRHHGTMQKHTAKAGDIVISEDFSKWTEGTEANPSTVNVADENGLLHDTLMQQQHWEGINCFQAGGSAFIGFIEEGDFVYGSIATPDFDASSVSSYTVKFKARSKSAAGTILDLYYNWFDEEMDDYNYSEVAESVEITQEWKEYSFECPAKYCAELSYADIFPSGDDYVYIDDFQIILGEGDDAANETINANNNKPSFFISGNNLSVRNVKLGSTVDICNVAGQKLQTTKYLGGGSIHIGNLPKGVYIIRVDGFSTKIVK